MYSISGLEGEAAVGMCVVVYISHLLPAVILCF